MPCPLICSIQFSMVQWIVERFNVCYWWTQTIQTKWPPQCHQFTEQEIQLHIVTQRKKSNARWVWVLCALKCQWLFVESVLSQKLMVKTHVNFVRWSLSCLFDLRVKQLFALVKKSIRISKLTFNGWQCRRTTKVHLFVC